MLTGITIAGDQYVFTFWLKSQADGSIQICGKTFSSTTSWAKHTVQFTATDTSLVIDFLQTGTYYIYHPKLEIGNRSTDWTPAPEDLEEKLNTYVSITDEKISLRATREEVNAIQIGGRNLLVGSSAWTEDSPAVTGSNADDYVYLTGTVTLEQNKVYTLQAVCNLPWSTAHGSGSGGDGKATIWIADTSRSYHRVFTGDGVTIGRYGWTFTHEGATGIYNVRINTYNTAGKFWDIKIESGQKATDWTPAPEDVDKQIKDFRAEYNTYIEQTGDKISLMATKDEVKSEVGSAVSDIAVGIRNLIRNSETLVYDNYYWSIPNYTVNAYSWYDSSQLGSSDTGPMENYALWINDVEQADFGAFGGTEGANVRSYTLPYGTKINVAVADDENNSQSYVSLNGTTVAGKSNLAAYEFIVTSHMTIKFECNRWGYSLTNNLHNYWNCYINTW